MILGIFSGLGCAVSQSLSYLFARNYVQGRTARDGSSHQLLILGHIWMGIFGLILLPFCWPAGAFATAVPWAKVLPWHCLNIFFYAAGQLFQMTALKHAEASRVSPLMTSKLIVSSILVMAFGQPVGDTTRFLSPMRWVAVTLCVIAGLAINFSGGRMKKKAMLAIAGSAVSFSCSDFGINKTIAAFLTDPHITSFQASLLTEAFTYITMLILVIPLLFKLGSRNTRDWRDAAPFAITWFVAMIGLFTAFANVGIMLGSILQCTRGFITILLAAGLMYRGHHHIEPLAPRRIVVRRLAAGVLMFVGITLYVIRDPANLKWTFPPSKTIPTESAPVHMPG